MSRITPTLARLKSDERKALIPFITAGFPSPAETVGLLHALVAGGADVLELGVPFSDPSADGAVIQAANDRALAQRVGLAHVLQLVRDFRRTNQLTPLVLMGYANPVERYDQKHASPQPGSAFVRDAAAAGVDGVLIVDYPPEECTAFAAELRAAGLDLIFLLAPTSTPQRMAQVGALASGYVYYVSLKGVTGSGALDTQAVAEMLPRIRAHVNCPVGVGFGIRDAASACAVGAVADAVVVGSRLIQIVDQAPPGQREAAAQAFMHTLRLALDAMPVRPTPPLHGPR